MRRVPRPQLATCLSLQQNQCCRQQRIGGGRWGRPPPPYWLRIFVKQKAAFCRIKGIWMVVCIRDKWGRGLINCLPPRSPPPTFQNFLIRHWLPPTVIGALAESAYIQSLTGAFQTSTWPMWLYRRRRPTTTPRKAQSGPCASWDCILRRNTDERTCVFTTEGGAENAGVENAGAITHGNWKAVRRYEYSVS